MNHYVVFLVQNQIANMKIHECVAKYRKKALSVISEAWLNSMNPEFMGIHLILNDK
jgi:hypothetical protein